MTKKKEEEKKKVVSIYDAYAVDLDKESDGVWEDLAFLPGAKVLIARFGNPASRKMMQRLQKPYVKGMRAGRDIPDEIQEDILNKVIAKTIWIGWENIPVPNEAGEVVMLQYSEENALFLLRDERLKDLRDEIVNLSRAADLFKATADEEAVINAKK